MPKGASIIADFGGNLDPLKRASNEAERHIDGFGKRVEGLFKRDPARRAALAFEQLGKNLAEGDVPQAVESFVGRLGGIGLAASIGIGTAIGLAAKASDAILAAAKSTRDLNTELSK